MVNLFRLVSAEQGSLTAALLALLEHCDPNLLPELLQLAGDRSQAQGREPASEMTPQPEAIFPAPDGPGGAGLIILGGRKLLVAAQAPGEAWDPSALTAQAEEVAGVLAVTLTDTAWPGVHSLSWEKLDRWLAAVADRYDPESRTGFLVRQFRNFLPERGIEYFAGFDLADAEQAVAAVPALLQFYQACDRFFDRLGPSLQAAREATLLRQSRAEELMAGYSFRDYGGPAAGPGGFLRVAFSLSDRELQVSCWTVGDGHGRLGDLLSHDTSFLEGLRRLRKDPRLWLWAPNDERKLLLDDFQPELLQTLDWDQYQAGVQRSLPFAELAREGLVGHVTGMAEELMAALAPALHVTVH